MTTKTLQTSGRINTYKINQILHNHYQHKYNSFYADLLMTTCRYCLSRVRPHLEIDDWNIYSYKNFGKLRNFDHVIPITSGGDNSHSNLVVSCRECNLKKRDKCLSDGGITLHSEKQVIMLHGGDYLPDDNGSRIKLRAQ